MSKVALIAIAVAAVCLAGGAAAFLLLQDKGYDIEYDLDGGHFNGGFPKKYEPGRMLDIPVPFKDGYVSAGFYTNPDLTRYFDGDTAGMEGVLKLYARWIESPVGHYAMYTVAGECDRGMSSYTMVGNQTRFVYYSSPWTGMLCTWAVGSNTYTYTETEEVYEKSVSDMHETPGFSDYRYLGTETIDTVEGSKLCDVYMTVYNNGATGTLWMVDGIPYKETYDYIGGEDSQTASEHTEYIYVSGGTVEFPEEGIMYVYKGRGITVPDLKETYRYGEMVTLTASVEKGKTFRGWYDGQYKLLSKERSYTFEFHPGNPNYVYALNGSQDMIRLEKGVEVDLESLFGHRNAIYTIYDFETGITKGLDTPYSFPKGGQFRINVVDENGVDRYAYEVLVSGSVQREYSWSWNGKDYTVSMELEYEDVRYANQYYGVSERRQDKPDHVRDMTFVELGLKDSVMAPYTERIADLLINAYKEKNSRMDAKDYLDYLLAFTQYIPYQTDEECLGYTEYWKFPLETLFDNGGDCEDTSILFIAVAYVSMEKLGFDYDLALQILPGHMSVAVRMPSVSGETNPLGYLYGETTAKGYRIGIIPEKVKESFTDESYYPKRSYTVEMNQRWPMVSVMDRFQSSIDSKKKRECPPKRAFERITRRSSIQTLNRGGRDQCRRPWRRPRTSSPDRRRSSPPRTAPR